MQVGATSTFIIFLFELAQISSSCNLWMKSSKGNEKSTRKFSSEMKFLNTSSSRKTVERKEIDIKLSLLLINEEQGAGGDRVREISAPLRTFPLALKYWISSHL